MNVAEHEFAGHCRKKAAHAPKAQHAQLYYSEYSQRTAQLRTPTDSASTPERVWPRPTCSIRGFIQPPFDPRNGRERQELSFRTIRHPSTLSRRSARFAVVCGLCEATTFVWTGGLSCKLLKTSY